MLIYKIYSYIDKCIYIYLPFPPEMSLLKLPSVDLFTVWLFHIDIVFNQGSNFTVNITQWWPHALRIHLCCHVSHHTETSGFTKHWHGILKTQDFSSLTNYKAKKKSLRCCVYVLNQQSTYDISPTVRMHRFRNLRAEIDWFISLVSLVVHWQYFFISSLTTWARCFSDLNYQDQ